jgi:ketosteroid isomerase-like protein
MKKALMIFTAAMFLVGMAVAQADAGSTDQALIQMEQKWAAESKANNPDALAPMLSDNFVNLDSDGTVLGKTETLGRMKKAKWETNEVSDMKVSASGEDTAIVTGTWHGKGTDAKGQSINASERFVDTWKKTGDGTWQCVASASAPMKQEQTAEK